MQRLYRIHATSLQSGNMKMYLIQIETAIVVITNKSSNYCLEVATFTSSIAPDLPIVFAIS